MDQLEATLMFANDAFYAAFASGDFEAMDDLWAKSHPVSCIHPGAPIMLSRTVVLESWRAILEGNEAPSIQHLDATPMVVGEVGWVTCLERVGESMIAATNIFVREDGQWKMTHHQAGPTTQTPRDEDPRPTQAH